MSMTSGALSEESCQVQGSLEFLPEQDDTNNNKPKALSLRCSLIDLIDNHLNAPAQSRRLPRHKFDSPILGPSPVGLIC